MAKTIRSTDLPTRWSRFHDEATVLIGSALALTVDTSQPYAAFRRQSTSANGDSFALSVPLRAGTYTFSVKGETNAANAMLDWYLDNVLVVSGQDWYSAAQTRDVVKTATVAVLFDGYHVLRAVVNGRNVANVTGWNIDLTKYWFKQASDLAPSAGLGRTFVVTDFPIRAELWHDEATAVVGGAITPFVNTSDAYNTHSQQANNADSFSHSCPLRAGTYTFSVLGITANNVGIIDWYLDGAVFLTGQDWYTASTTFNVVKTGSVTVITDGYHSIQGTTNGKNASSAGFPIALTKYWFRQAAD